MRKLLLLMLILLLMGCVPAEEGVETVPINWWPWIRAAVIWSIPLLIGTYAERWGWDVLLDEEWYLIAFLLWPISWPFVAVGILFSRIVVPAMDAGISRLTRKKIHEDGYGILYTQRTPDRDSVALFVQVKDETGRHTIRVDRKVTTAKEAVAWTFDMKPEEYNPIRQT